MYVLIGADKSILISVPSLDDTIDLLYGPSSICGGQLITLTTSSGLSPDYISASLEAKTDDLTLMGEHSLDCTITLDKYPSVTTTLPLTLILYSLEAPGTPDDLIYKVTDDKLIFEVE